jgi:repressor LexA
MTAAADHVRALRRKNVLAHQPRRARAHSVISRFRKLQRQVMDIPVFGVIPAGFADECHEEAVGCLSVDVGSLGLRPNAQMFALEVRGDSMIGKHILDGDYVIVDRSRTPCPGDVVAALIDNESTLKTLVIERGKPCLRAENPRYPRLTPATELAIQGVMVGLVRRAR